MGTTYSYMPTFARSVTSRDSTRLKTVRGSSIPRAFLLSILLRKIRLPYNRESSAYNWTRNSPSGELNQRSSRYRQLLFSNQLISKLVSLEQLVLR